MNIAQKLQQLIDQTGVSRSRLAREIGVHTSSVSNWLSGKDVKAENIQALCEFFNCSPEYFMDEQEKKATPGITENDLKAAFWGGEKDLTDEELDALWADVREYAQFKLNQKKGRL